MSFRNGTVGVVLVNADLRNIGPARLPDTAAEMARPMTSILLTSSMRSSASESRGRMNRKTSHVLISAMMMASLGVGISLARITLPMRVLTNSTAVPSCEPVYSSVCQTDRDSVQNSPSWYSRIPRLTRFSSTPSMTSSARWASRSIQYCVLLATGSDAISFRIGSSVGSPVSVLSRRNRVCVSMSIFPRSESSARAAPIAAQFKSQPGT